MNTQANQIQLSSDSKVWIFTPDRKLNQSEVVSIQDELSEFSIQWVSHGNSLSATGILLYEYFPVMAVDNAAYTASGCSIDSMHRFMQTLGLKYSTDFMGRKVFQYLDDNKSLHLIRQEEIKNALNNGQITPSTLFFDNTVSTLDELKSNWVKPLDTFWLMRII